MKYTKISTIALSLLLGFLSISCSDDYMERLNTDNTKASTVDPNGQLTTAELQTYGDLNLVEVYRNYFYPFTQQLMGNWNSTNYGGRHTRSDQEMLRLWSSLYTTADKNLVDGLYATKDDESKVNIHAIMRVYRTYIISLLTDAYGDVPYSEAGLGFIKGITDPKFDLQKDIYTDFFAQLDSAVTELDASKDVITGDLIYKGDINKWKKLANSLRLRYAMRISDVDPSLAKKQFEAAANAPSGVLSSLSDDALIPYMNIAFSFGQESYSDYRGNALSKLLFGNDPSNNPSYVCSTFFNELKDTDDPRTFMYVRCYYDGLMSSTSPSGRVDLTQEMLDSNIPFAPCKPGAFSWEPWPTGYTSTILTNMAVTNSAVNPAVAREVEPKVANNFLKSDNPGVIMTSAEVELLLAEAKLKGWNVSGTVQSHYEAGVRLAMDFLSANYGFDTVSAADFQTYITANGIGHTTEQAKEAINTQAWILHFNNPNECWANLRRSGYPKLKTPSDYGFDKFVVDGKEIPVRLTYPVLESSYNKKGYQEALDRMGGTDSWNTHVWWDVN